MNFSSSIMEPKIFCSCLQSDGYEVENLITTKKKVKLIFCSINDCLGSSQDVTVSDFFQ